MFKVETIQKDQIDRSEVLVASSATKAPCKALIFLLCPDRSHGRTYRPIGRQIAGSACLSIRELDLYGNLPPANDQASRIMICLTRLCLTTRVTSEGSDAAGRCSSPRATLADERHLTVFGLQFEAGPVGLVPVEIYHAPP